jgi:hypothetical protein
MNTWTPAKGEPVDQPAINIEQDEDALGELITAVRPRLGDVDDHEARELVAAALSQFGSVRVTSFLPILVERSIRDLRGQRTPAPA